MKMMVQIQLLLTTGEKHSLPPHVFDKRQYGSQTFNSANSLCKAFGVCLPNSAYGWREGRISVGNEKALREYVARDEHYAKLYPNESIAEISLYVQRLD